MKAIRGKSLSKSMAERLKVAASIERSELGSFLDSLEVELRDGLPDEKCAKGMEELLRMRKFAASASASVKMITEHLAVVL